ncbi:MAG: prepilin-type N-terminal cleavage/methylation domain-containing protein [Planctomycetes bacterium]|nr:prepilin-type N-terminal cleavage/methylation domain-containing protein [Planctomycetota bacterium]
MNSPHTVRRSAGFTLVEIMVVIVILGLLAGIVVPNLFSNVQEARETTTKANAQAVLDALKQYLTKTGKNNAELEDLVTPDARGATILERAQLKDAWDNEFELRKLDGYMKFEVGSKGQDGVVDTEDDVVVPPRSEN